MSERVIVLVIGPDRATHDLVLAALGDECAVLGARSPALGLTLAGKRSPEVVILDDPLPDPEASAAEFRAASPHVRFVFLVDPSRPRDEVARLTPLGTVVPRPVDVERLRASVRSAARLGAMAAGVRRMRTGSFPIGRPPR